VQPPEKKHHINFPTLKGSDPPTGGINADFTDQEEVERQLVAKPSLWGCRQDPDDKEI